jgi:hypothetical protein
VPSPLMIFGWPRPAFARIRAKDILCTKWNIGEKQQQVFCYVR